ncbi:hypothetical protein FPANT_2437 [Fusarium pseudoanthophilum]|uniref:Uncharacterized protein n=1 Tax=Fusarium pseudoanthophilum TaxID=48495 RepID=A0A8H5UV51_9HYPO|nr:hypothetical protein FPANT_2437 [Fusarium pseudoanthophilum]
MAPTRKDKKQHNRDGFARRAARTVESAQSGSGRGTLGPNKSRDLNKDAQTMVERDGITTNQRTETEDHDDRPARIKTEEGRVHDSGEDMMDPPVEPQTNSTHNDMEINDEVPLFKFGESDITRAIHDAEAAFGTTELTITFKPYRPDRVAQAKNRKAKYDAVMSTSTVIPRKIILSRPLNERVTTPSEGRTTRPQGETASQECDLSEEE